MVERECPCCHRPVEVEVRVTASSGGLSYFVESFSTCVDLFRSQGNDGRVGGRRYNGLFAQALRDMTRYEVDSAAFVSRMAGETRTDLAQELSQILTSGTAPEATVPLAHFAAKLVKAFGERILRES